jgi:NAD(P)H dehydrogenase (quinone)
MSTQTVLVIGATGETGRHTVKHLLEKGRAVRAMVHKEDERSEALRRTGAEVVSGELLEHDDAIQAAAGTSLFLLSRQPGTHSGNGVFCGRG